MTCRPGLELKHPGKAPRASNQPEVPSREHNGLVGEVPSSPARRTPRPSATPRPPTHTLQKPSDSTELDSASSPSPAGALGAALSILNTHTT